MTRVSWRMAAEELGLGGFSATAGSSARKKEHRYDVTRNLATSRKFICRVHAQYRSMYSASYLVVPTFDILTCDDVLLPRAGSTGAIKF